MAAQAFSSRRPPKFANTLNLKKLWVNQYFDDERSLSSPELPWSNYKDINEVRPGSPPIDAERTSFSPVPLAENPKVMQGTFVETRAGPIMYFNWNKWDMASEDENGAALVLQDSPQTGTGSPAWSWPVTPLSTPLSLGSELKTAFSFEPEDVFARTLVHVNQPDPQTFQRASICDLFASDPPLDELDWENAHSNIIARPEVTLSEPVGETIGKRSNWVPLSELAGVVPDAILPGHYKLCSFCKNNGESLEFYMSHPLKEITDQSEVIIRCPVLRRYQCQICGYEGGDYAHTARYCPKNYSISAYKKRQISYAMCKAQANRRRANKGSFYSE